VFALERVADALNFALADMHNATGVFQLLAEEGEDLGRPLRGMLSSAAASFETSNAILMAMVLALKDEVSS
jgi:hypothetical protein